LKIQIPLKQHVGGPCKPVIEAGDSVQRGQLIAVPNGLGANIHTSVQGRVEHIDETMIYIVPDEEQPDTFEMIPETSSHLEAIEDAGIVGAGGAGFPTHIKLKTDLNGGHVIVNAAECEPILNHNIDYMGDYAEALVRGVKYVMDITNAAHGYIAIKPKHRDTMLAIGKACKSVEGVEVKFLPDMYPAGDERVIIRELLNVELQPGELPMKAGAVVINVETIKNIVAAIEERKPVITKDITVAGRVGDAKKGRVFSEVPIGMPVEHYIEASGGYVKPYGEIVLGGPFTGQAGSPDSPITKTSGGILVSMPFPEDKRKVGLIECECGAGEERLNEIASGMNAEVVGSVKCKRMVEVNGRFRCDKPGACPGQAEKVLELKKRGAEVIITGTCED